MTEQGAVMKKRERVGERLRQSIERDGNLNLKGLRDIKTREITTRWRDGGRSGGEPGPSYSCPA